MENSRENWENSGITLEKPPKGGGEGGGRQRHPQTADWTAFIGALKATRKIWEILGKTGIILGKIWDNTVEIVG